MNFGEINYILGVFIIVLIMGYINYKSIIARSQKLIKMINMKNI